MQARGRIIICMRHKSTSHYARCTLIAEKKSASPGKHWQYDACDELAPRGGKGEWATG